MMQKSKSLTALAIFLGALISVCMISASASIQEEANAAVHGDTITVAAGNLQRNIHIDKSSIINGAGSFPGNELNNILNTSDVNKSLESKSRIHLQNISSIIIPKEEWNKTFGGANFDQGLFAQATNDGGYIIAGDTSSYGAGGTDAWLIKTDSAGNELWNKTLGGKNEDLGSFVQETSGGGYILVGSTSSYSSIGDRDVWLVNTDPLGNELWNKTFGGKGTEYGYFGQETSDGGYVLAGHTWSYGAGDADAWLVKTDSAGNELWNKTFGGTDVDYSYSVRETSNGGYIIGGYTYSFYSGDRNPDAWLIKTDSAGNELWNKTFGGLDNDFSFSVREISNGGYVITGGTRSYDVGGTDAWLVKTDSVGNEIWNKTFGGASYDVGYSVQEIRDGGYAIAGYTSSYSENFDVWLIKTGSAGNKLWDKTFGGTNEDRGYSVQETGDRGYIIAGRTKSYGDGGDVILIKVETENTSPNTPFIPSGPTIGTTGTSYSYTTSATDPDDDQIAYIFDWGDGTNSTTALLDSGAIANATHIWNIAGIYVVKAKATDSNGLDSEWSNAINVSIANNSCIFGTKFNDTNFNATRDAGEAGLPGWTIRLTRPDGTTINATTDANGAYKFENLTSGTYRVSEIRQSNWTQTYPAWLGDHTVNITDGNITGLDFGNSFLPVPDIPFPPSGPASGILGAEYSYSTSSTDPSGYQISYTFDWGDGTNYTTGLFDSGALASAAHIWSSSGDYQVRAMATNSKGAASGWSGPLNVTINAPPHTPAKPTGPASGVSGASYCYSTSATDPDGDRIAYTFYWGDGSNSTTALFDSGAVASATHIWNSSGAFLVRAMATDSRGAASGWSEPLNVTINAPPQTPAKPTGPSSGLSATSYSYSTSATDPDGDQVKYTFNWGDGTTSQTDPVSSGTNASLSHAWSAAGTYLVKAMATDSKSAESAWSGALTVTITPGPNRAPSVPSIPTGPTSGVAGTVYSFSTSATDPNGDQVKYTFSWGDGTTTTTVLFNSGNDASASHKWSTPGTYLVKARARDSKGLASAYSSSVTITIAPNSPPAIAAKPSGPISGIAGTVYSYSTSAIDPNKDQVKYTFSWGDGTTTTTALVDSGTSANASHKWAAVGSYLVKAKATDSKGLASAYSSSVTVKIAANSPPAIPLITSGATSGNPGKSYSYTASATDPNGDQVKYIFSWGDGTTTTTTLVDSGMPASASHKWAATGTYLVRARARDSKGATSALSSSLAVKIAAPGYYGNASDQIAPIPSADTDLNSSPTGVNSSLKNAREIEARARSQADQKAQELRSRAAQIAREQRGEA